MAGPTQPQVVNEQWDETRLAEFLKNPPSGKDPEGFRLLLRAYRGMRPLDFDRYLKIFVAAGYRLDETNCEDKTLKEIISNHRHAPPYLAALEKYEPE